MAETYLLGIDSGTSVVKSVVFDTDGREIAVARRELPVVSPAPGYSEIDMNAAWDAMAATIREVVAAVGSESIAAVGLSGTACGYWGIDADGQPVRNAILWNDGRAGDIISGWQSDGTYSQIFAQSGNAMFPGYSLSLLRWLADHEPDTLDRTRWLLFHKDWLRYRLTGAVHTEHADVSYYPANIFTGEYSPELFDMAGVSIYQDRLPPLVRSHDVVGAVTDTAAGETGLRAGTPVVAGAVDVVVSALGGGAARPGQACAILGTSFLNSLVTSEPSLTPADAGNNALMPNGVWIRSLANLAGTINIDWVVRELAGEERAAAERSGTSVYDLIEATIQTRPPGANGLVYLPYLSNAGINAPFVDPNARAQFFGFSIDHTRADLMRAVYEGTALAMRDCYTAIDQPFDEVILVGGGSRSAFWTQMFADATGRRITVTEGSEFGARGAAIIAGVGTGVYESFEAALAATIRPAQTFEPQPENARIYEKIYELYHHLRINARDAWQLRRLLLDDIQN